MVFVASADQEGREPQLCHRTDRYEDEKEWMIMCPDVRHLSKIRVKKNQNEWVVMAAKRRESEGQL